MVALGAATDIRTAPGAHPFADFAKGRERSLSTSTRLAQADFGFNVRFTWSGSRAMSIRWARVGWSGSARPCSQSRKVPSGM